MEDMESY